MTPFKQSGIISLMQDLTGTTLLNSIKADLTPQTPYEDVEIIHTGIDLCLNIEDLVGQLKKYQQEGFHTIRMVSQGKTHQTIELIRHRNPEDLIQYRLDYVEHKLLRWLRDSFRKQNIILQEKTLSLANYQARVQKLKTICPNTQKTLDQKTKRTEQYHQAVAQIKEILDNYPNYTYEELTLLANKLSFDGGVPR